MFWLSGPDRAPAVQHPGDPPMAEIMGLYIEHTKTLLRPARGMDNSPLDFAHRVG